MAQTVRPLASYRGSFVPFPGELVAGDKTPDGCVKPSEGALMLAGRTEIGRELAELLGVSRSLVVAWQTGERRPVAERHGILESCMGIPAVAWGLWRKVVPEASPTQPSAAVPPPPSAPSLPTEGTPQEQRAALIKYLTTPGLTKGQIDQAKALQSALAFEARNKSDANRPRRLDEHPDFEPFLDRLVVGLRSIPGALDAMERAVSDPTQ
jgi:hypothetical protein